MALQGIYQWFRNDSHKGSSNTKGWKNSIRHNLSMNAAFENIERETSGDNTKKSTEWVLKESAVRNGVQPTTRYRKGAGARRSKYYQQTRSSTLQRQRSPLTSRSASTIASSSDAPYFYPQVE
ncbi:uncharacterized protein RAG0_03023 [Rhynchosporium agropyri]|uniref:Fork-head domain-containing protein n=1 Tax=Rhynchosporium agropyri TaxID=914238 RepID=A0A1E1K384_9HELO|nr:uncharacterized protein RAG0_03023 [Rhynchosporium agropyri]